MRGPDRAGRDALLQRRSGRRRRRPAGTTTPRASGCSPAPCSCSSCPGWRRVSARGLAQHEGLADSSAGESASMPELDGVRGLTIAFADMNGIPRSRTVPIARLDGRRASAASGITTLFPVFLVQRRDHVRVRAALERLRRCAPAGDAGAGRAAGRAARVRVDAGPAVPARRRALALLPARRPRAGGRAGGRGRASRCAPDSSSSGSSATPTRSSSPAHHGPVYSPHAMLAGRRVRRAAAGRPGGQRHPGRPAARRVRARPDGALDRRRRPGGGRRPAAARPPDDPRGGPRTRAARVLRAAGRRWRRSGTAGTCTARCCATAATCWPAATGRAGMTAEGEA